MHVHAYIDGGECMLTIGRTHDGMSDLALGAGQDVGRSCILVSLGGKNIMFDCGMHMGYNDHRRFPNFSYISQNKKLEQIIDCVIISHLYVALPIRPCAYV
jgi:predicted metal-dependent RNase